MRLTLCRLVVVPTPYDRPWKVLTLTQTYANELCRGYLDAFQIKAGDVHQYQVLQGLGLMTQLCPSLVWGEAMHTSGLFPHLLKAFITDEVCAIIPFGDAWK